MMPPGMRPIPDPEAEVERLAVARKVVPPSFSREELRAFLKECVTVVAPGETLIVRTTDLIPAQMREYQEAFNFWHEHGDLPFRVLVVHGDGLGVREAE